MQQRNWARITLHVAVIALALAGAGIAYPARTEPSRLAADVGPAGGLSPELPSTSSPLGFALDLFRESFTEDGDSGNVLVSPYSVTEAFAMACIGAAGDTRDEMARVLGLEFSDPADIMQARQRTHEHLRSLAPDATLTVTNSIWMADRADIAFRSEFVKTCSDVFGAEARSVDFSDPKTVSLINDWVKRNTQGKIPSVVNTIPPEQIAALVNAVYMKARWQHPFNPIFTEKAQFNLPAGTTAECEMMSGGASGIQYLDGASFQAIRLPYVGDELGMYLFLPDEDTDLAAFVEGLSPGDWSRWMDEFKPTNVRMRLPRFKFEYDLDLIPPLTDLGMGSAFDPVKADFSAMCEAPESVPVYIGMANHRTFISVDEEGTEAAAATYVAVVGSAAPQNVVEITFDRPFLFAVVDNADPSLILFLGSVIRP